MRDNSYWGAVLCEVVGKDDPNVKRLLTSFLGEGDVSSHEESQGRHKRNTNGQKPRRYYLGDNYHGEYFTEREFECVLLLIRGRSLKQIAGDLALSRRTIEYYLKNVKCKMGAYSRSDLISRALSLELVQKHLCVPL